MEMRRVVLETPYSGWSGHHVAYTHTCMLDCFGRREAPMVGHLLYPPHLGPEGVDAGLAWESVVEHWVVYLDLGITHNMRKGIERAVRLHKRVDVRSLETKAANEVARLQLAMAGKVAFIEAHTCKHEMDTPVFDPDRTKPHILTWTCACGHLGPSADEARTAIRETTGGGRGP